MCSAPGRNAYRTTIGPAFLNRSLIEPSSKNRTFIARPLALTTGIVSPGRVAIILLLFARLPSNRNENRYRKGALPSGAHYTSGSSPAKETPSTALTGSGRPHQPFRFKGPPKPSHRSGRPVNPPRHSAPRWDCSTCSVLSQALFLRFCLEYQDFPADDTGLCVMVGGLTAHPYRVILWCCPKGLRASGNSKGFAAIGICHTLSNDIKEVWSWAW